MYQFDASESMSKSICTELIGFPIVIHLNSSMIESSDRLEGSWMLTKMLTMLARHTAIARSRHYKTVVELLDNSYKHRGCKDRVGFFFKLKSG